MNFDNMCQICRENSAPYKCPKCRLRYCSLNCYHNEIHDDCSKEFLEKQNLTTTNPFVKGRIEEILKRKLDEKDFHDEDNDEQMEEFFQQISSQTEEKNSDSGEERFLSDDEEEEGEEETAATGSVDDLPNDLDESEANIHRLWACLTAEEKKDFQSMINDGRISHLLNDYKPWKPWWLYRTSAPPLVTELNAAIASPTFPSNIPVVNSPIVPLPSLTSILPHVHVRFDLMETLFGYVLINVRYRGEFNSYLPESGEEFLQIASGQFDQHQVTSDETDVLQIRISLLRESVQSKELTFQISEEFFINILADIIKIIHGPFQANKPSNDFVLSALSDLHRFLTKFRDDDYQLNETRSEVKNVFHSNRPRTSLEKPKKNVHRKVLQKFLRKIEYLLSWTMTHSDRLRILESELTNIENDLRRRFSEYQKEKIRVEKHLKSLRVTKKPVEEMS